MVDAGNLPAAVVHILVHPQLLKQPLGAALYGVAEAHRFNVREPLHIAGQHGHGVGVVEEQGVGAPALHVVGVGLHHRDSAQRPENSSDSQRIGDGLPQAVLFGHFKIGDGAGIVKPHLNGVDHEIRSPESRLPIQGLGDMGLPVGSLVNVAENLIRFIQPLWVNIKKTDVKFPQFRSQNTVSYDVSGKNRASCTDKCNFHTFLPFFRKAFLPL